MVCEKREEGYRSLRKTTGFGVGGCYLYLIAATNRPELKLRGIKGRKISKFLDRRKKIEGRGGDDLFKIMGSMVNPDENFN